MGVSSHKDFTAVGREKDLAAIIFVVGALLCSFLGYHLFRNTFIAANPDLPRAAFEAAPTTSATSRKRPARVAVVSDWRENVKWD
jgi:hypothetical protein